MCTNVMNTSCPNDLHKIVTMLPVADCAHVQIHTYVYAIHDVEIHTLYMVSMIVTRVK